MAILDFNTLFGTNPWEVVDKNQREWYFPEVAFMYKRRTVYGQFVPWAYDMRSIRATKAIITFLLPPHPDANPIGLRQYEVEPRHVDSMQVEVTFQHYGGKVLYTKYDDIVTYWRMNRRAGLRQIMRQALGIHMVESLELIMRNAYIKAALDSGRAMFAGTATDFGTLTTADRFDPAVAQDIWLAMAYRGLDKALGADGAAGRIMAITSPSVIYTIREAIRNGTVNDEWISVTKYTQPTRVLNYEVGEFLNTRYLQTSSALLWNAGAVTYQFPVITAINAGDGAPDPQTTKVDATWRVGQDGVRHYIEISQTALQGTAVPQVGDYVTIHVSRTSAYGVTDGVDPFDSRNHVRRIVAVNTVGTTSYQLALDKPIMIDMNVDLGGGTFAYVTKGINISATLFLGATGRDGAGVVAAVAQPPMVHELPPIDDMEAIYRFSWDAYLGANLVNPDVFEVYFSVDPVRVVGSKFN